MPQGFSSGKSAALLCEGDGMENGGSVIRARACRSVEFGEVEVIPNVGVEVSALGFSSQ
jgi:hypothetical protein